MVSEDAIQRRKSEQCRSLTKHNPTRNQPPIRKTDPLFSNMTTPKYYVSVTGLRVKSIWHMPTFARHAYTSKRQADSAEGNIHASVKSRDGVQHTLTVWRDKASMRRYFVSGAHREAMKLTPLISDVYGQWANSFLGAVCPSTRILSSTAENNDAKARVQAVTMHTINTSNTSTIKDLQLLLTDKN